MVIIGIIPGTITTMADTDIVIVYDAYRYIFYFLERKEKKFFFFDILIWIFLANFSQLMHVVEDV